MRWIPARKGAIFLGTCLAVLTALPGDANALCMRGCLFFPCMHAGYSTSSFSTFTPMGAAVSPLLTSSLATSAFPVTYYNTGAVSPLLTSSLATASVPVIQTASIPVYQTYYTTALSAVTAATPSVTSPLLRTAATGPTTVSPLLRTASASGQVSTASTPADTIAEYNRFLLTESAAYPAGIMLPSSDTLGLNRNFPGLVNAIGLDRLHSIGRFLMTKLEDPNFRAKALDLFGAVLGTALPQFEPLIDAFLGELNPGGRGGWTPPTRSGGNNTVGNLPVNANGELVVRVIMDSGDQAGPAPRVPKPPDVGGLLRPGQGTDPLANARLVTNADGSVDVVLPDGTKRHFDKNGIPRP